MNEIGMSKLLNNSIKFPENIPKFKHLTFYLGKGEISNGKQTKYKFVDAIDIDHQQEMRDICDEYYFINHPPSLPRPAWADTNRTGVVPGETLEEYYVRNRSEWDRAPNNPNNPNNPNFLEMIDNCKNGIPWYIKHHRILKEFRNEIETEISNVT